MLDCKLPHPTQATVISSMLLSCCCQQLRWHDPGSSTQSHSACQHGLQCMSGTVHICGLHRPAIGCCRSAALRKGRDVHWVLRVARVAGAAALKGEVVTESAGCTSRHGLASRLDSCEALQPWCPQCTAAVRTASARQPQTTAFRRISAKRARCGSVPLFRPPSPALWSSHAPSLRQLRCIAHGCAAAPQIANSSHARRP